MLLWNLVRDLVAKFEPKIAILCYLSFLKNETSNHSKSDVNALSIVAFRICSVPILEELRLFEVV